MLFESYSNHFSLSRYHRLKRETKSGQFRYVCLALTIRAFTRMVTLTYLMLDTRVLDTNVRWVSGSFTITITRDVRIFLEKCRFLGNSVAIHYLSLRFHRESFQLYLWNESAYRYKTKCILKRIFFSVYRAEFKSKYCIASFCILYLKLELFSYFL